MAHDATREEQSGGTLVVQWLQARGIELFFEVPGESFLAVLDALHDADKIRIATMRHESGASFAAEAFAKVSGRPAVCMATRGPGSSNLSIGVQTAYYDGTPLIALVGLVPRSMQGSRAFQEFDPFTFFGSMAKRVLTVNARAALSATLDQALVIATEGRPGPVVVGLPTDVLNEMAIDNLAPQKAHAAVHGEVDVTELFAMLRGAQNPAVVLGTAPERGAVARVIEQLAESEGLPVYCAWRRFSAFDNGHANFAGAIGLGTPPEVIAGLAEVDVAIAFGFALDQITCQSGRLDRAGLRLIQVAPGFDPDITRHAPSAELYQVVADPLAVAEALLAHAQRDGPTRRAVAPRVVFPQPTPATSGLQIDYAMAKINEYLPSDAIVASDAGNFGHWVIRRIVFDQSRAYLGPVNGAMGYGLPAAIGASLASPGRPCFSFSGDGGFAMTFSEMETANRLGLSLVAFVFDNGVYGTIRARQDLEYPGRFAGTGLGPIDFATAARAAGWSGFTVRANDAVDATLREALGAPGCRLVHFIIDELPLVPDVKAQLT